MGHATPRSSTTRLWLVALAGLGLAVLAGCQRTPPEAALRATIDELQQAIDARQADDVAALLSEDFIGPDGMDRDATRRYATVAFMRHREVATTIGPIDLTLQDDHARVRFTAALAGGGGRLLPDTARVRTVDTGWRLESGEWRLLSASWED